MNSRILTGVLAGAYPALFFASNNWYLYRRTQVLAFVGIVAAASACLLMLASWSLELAMRALPVSEGKSRRILDALHALAATGLCLALFGRTLKYLQFPALGILLVLLLLVGAASWQSYRGGLSRLNFALAFFALFSAAQWVVGISTASSVDDDWNHAHEEFNRGIELERTPNIYYILAESYPNRAALREVFGIDNTPFYSEMEERGFSVVHEMFSNYNATLTSLAALFSMEHHYYRISDGIMDSVVARAIINSTEYNAVIDILHRNGYFVQYVHPTAYQLKTMGPGIDYTWPSSSTFSLIDEFIGRRPTLYLQAALDRGAGRDSKREYHDLTSERFAIAAEDARPYFTYHYLSAPGHSPYDTTLLYDTETATRIHAEFREKFIQRVEKANWNILDAVDRILENDDDALIIVSGDHGAYGYRMVDVGIGRAQAKSTIATDRLGIFTAIRFPRGEDVDLEGLRSSVNLFRHVFEELSGDPAVLATKAADDGYLELRDGITASEEDCVAYLAVEDGRVLEEWKPLRGDSSVGNGTKAHER